jgi:hypothetical protein
MTKKETELQHRWAAILARYNEADEATRDNNAVVREHDAANAQRLLEGKDIDDTSPVQTAKRTKSACQMALLELFLQAIALVTKNDTSWRIRLPEPYPEDVITYVRERYESRQRAKAQLAEDLHVKSELERISKKIESAKMNWAYREGRDLISFSPREHLTDEEKALYDSEQAKSINFKTAGGGPAQNATTLDEREQRMRDAEEARRVREADLGITEEEEVTA